MSVAAIDASTRANMVIDGTILQRLDRDVVDPKLDEKWQTGWLGDAART